MFRSFSTLCGHKTSRFWGLGLCFVLVAFAVAQDVRFNRSAMEGRFTGSPSTIAIRTGSRRVARSRSGYRKRLVAQRTEKQRSRSQVQVRLASLRGRDYSRRIYVAQNPVESGSSSGLGTRPSVGGGGTASAGQIKPGSGKPTGGKTGGSKPTGAGAGKRPSGGGGKTTPPRAPNLDKPATQLVIEVPRQNLSFKLLDLKGQPVKGVQMVAFVNTPAEDHPTARRFTSNDAGVCELKDLPVPASLDFDLVRADGSLPAEPSDENKVGNDEDEENEWSLAHPELASLLLERPEGASRVARLYPAPASQGQGVCGAPCVAPLTQIKVFETTKAPLILERNVVDLQIAAPANSHVSSPILGEEVQTVPADGLLQVRLKRSRMEEGSVPIRIERALPGGESEAVIESYPTDPYEVNRVEAPPLELVSLSDLNPALHMGVFDTRADAVRALGDLAGKDNRKNQLGAITPSADGAQWWISPAKGIGLKMRPVPGSKPKDKAPELVCERIRVFNAAGGTFGGVGTNSSWAEARAALGDPQVDNAPRLPSDALSAAGQMASYLDGGLRICHNDEKVLWLEVARPDAFLRGGTTAFVERPQAKLYVASFTGHPKTNLRTRADLEGFLRQIGSVQLVPSRDDADLVLQAAVVDFKEDRDDFLPLIPIRYDCSLRLRYSLFDTRTNRPVVEDKEVEGRAGANFTKEAAIIGIGAGLLHKKAGGLVSALIAGFGIADLNRAVRKAANRAPAVSAKNAFNRMVDDINDAADFSVQVTSIDYANNRLTINAGTDDGVRVGDASHPFDFQLEIAGGQLPFEDEPKSAEFYAARVVKVGPTSSVCELHHIQRTISKAKEKVQDEPAPDVLRQIPDPATGLVVAQAGVQFPDVEVVTEAQVEAATQQANTGQQEAPDEGNADGQQKPEPKKKGIGDILGGILGR